MAYRETSREWVLKVYFTDAQGSESLMRGVYGSPQSWGKAVETLCIGAVTKKIKEGAYGTWIKKKYGRTGFNKLSHINIYNISA